LKRIVICADGTWNVRDQASEEAKTRRPTNVTKVARAVRSRAADGVHQVVYYHDGVGTGVGLKDKLTGGAFGSGIEDNVRDLYRFILYNYVDGDELFFFGFSRGAFTVRTLAGFMNKVGLISKDKDYFVPEIYACYENNEQPGSRAWQKAFGRAPAAQVCPPIKFIGVWDTVGALGAPGLIGQLFNRNKYQYHDIGLNGHIQNAVQALAIDERREPFRPSLWSRTQAFTGSLEQAWFAGVHSNVGGSCDPDGLANEALHWIVGKAEDMGLEFDNKFLTYFPPCFNSEMQDSMTLKYKVFGAYVRPIGRQLADGEIVHKSAMDRMHLPACDYSPENLQAYIHKVGKAPTSDTTRIPRGVACAEVKKPKGRK
jgi:uncharacterized protein (DUF2235 family)